MKFQRSFKCLLLFVGIGLIGSCNKMDSKEPSVTRLARVDADYLTLKKARKQIPDFLMAKDSIQALQNYRQKWIRQQLVVKEAHQLQLMKHETVQERLAQARAEVLTQALKDVIIAQFNEKVQISEAEVQNYYKKHKKQMKLEQRYIRFRHIATKDIASARAAQEELEEGGAWPEVALQYSIQPQEKVEQAQKYWPQSVVLNEVPIMQQILPELEPGEVSPIRRVRGTYHVVELLGARKKGTNAKPAWLMEQLKKWLLSEKRRKYYNSYLKNLYFSAESDNELEVFNVLTSTDHTNSDTVKTNHSNE